MSDLSTSIEIAMRIPGAWSHPRELVEGLPEGHQLTADALTLPDGTKVGFGAMPADGQFAQIFRSSCRGQATDDELATVDNYKVNAMLSGPGGTMAAAHTMMQAASAIIRAGGAGVFIDNSAVAHGGTDWLGMTEDGSPEALSFAFVSIVGSDTEVYTVGMHVLGLRDILMKRADADTDEFGIIDVIRYLANGEKPVDDGHIIADLDGPRFQAFVEQCHEALACSPMNNPFGRLKLVSVKDIAERN